MLEKLMQNMLTVTPNNPPKQTLPSLLKNKHTSMQAKNTYTSYLTIAIWQTRSTKDMFDYENNHHLKVRDYKIYHQHPNDIYVSEVDDNRCSVVARGTFNQGLLCGRIDMLHDKVVYEVGRGIDNFEVVNHTKKKLLTVGDVIKIGRMKYLVKVICDGKKLQQTIPISKSNKMSNHFSKCSGTCKFCLSDDTDDDPLISPCLCKGSCAGVHVSCLKQWLSNKVTRKSTQTAEFINYDNFACELCKQELPVTFIVGNKTYEILQEGSQKTGAYLTLQGIQSTTTSTKNNIQIKINFPTFEKKAISLGRGHECDVKLEDVSISRKHCLIEKSSNGFYLKDNKSKFGTLVLLDQGQKVEMVPQTRIQVGKMTLQVTQKESKKNLQNYKYY